LSEKAAAGECYNDIGTVYFKKKEYKKALDNFLIAMKLRGELNDKYGLSSSYINLGNVYFKQEDSKKAIMHVEKGLQIAKEIGELEWMRNAYKSLAEIYDSTKNYKLAYKYGDLYKEVNDSMFNLEKQKKFNEMQMMQVEYEQSQKDAKAEQEIKQSKNYSQQCCVRDGVNCTTINYTVNAAKQNCKSKASESIGGRENPYKQRFA